VYRYTEHNEGLINDVQFTAILKTQKKWSVQYICAVVEVPQNISHVPGIEQFFAQVRKSLGAKYASFPWWKSLGTYVVLSCDHELYEKLCNAGEMFKDRTGLHMNVMLGICLVDRETLDNSTDSTWGLLYSGGHYRAICDAVSQWCEDQMK